MSVDYREQDEKQRRSCWVRARTSSL